MNLDAVCTGRIWDEGQKALGQMSLKREAIGQDPIVKLCTVRNGKPQWDLKWVPHIICVLEKQHTER